MGEGTGVSEMRTEGDADRQGLLMQAAAPRSWACLVSAALWLGVARGTPESHHDPYHMN